MTSYTNICAGTYVPMDKQKTDGTGGVASCRSPFFDVCLDFILFLDAYVRFASPDSTQ